MYHMHVSVPTLPTYVYRFLRGFHDIDSYRIVDRYCLVGLVASATAEYEVLGSISRSGTYSVIEFFYQEFLS